MLHARARVLATAVLLLIAPLALGLPAPATAGNHVPWPTNENGDPFYEDLGVFSETNKALLLPAKRIHEIRAPLMTVPAITTWGGTFSAELDIAATTVAVEFWIVNDAYNPCGILVEDLGRGSTNLWADDADLEVHHYHLTVVKHDGDHHYACPLGMYTLVAVLHDTVTGRTWFDEQTHSVFLMDPARHAALASGAAEPRFAVIADPQVGDPRAFQDGFEGSLDERDGNALATKFDGVLGDLSESEDGRWKAFHKVVSILNDADLDFVLIAGDLGFGQMFPGSYAFEYEEIYRVLTHFQVPIYATLGNHDGYISNGQDGFEYWRAYMGPTYYATTLTPGTHLVNLNAYDWSEMDRLGFSYAVSAWGGQVRDVQLAWLETTLTDLRAAHPTDRIIGMSHQSPSWRQDPYRDADPTGITAASDGVPVAEQVTRGAVAYATTDQGWTGRGLLEVRDALRNANVEMHFAGHTHRDRIARDDGTGRIVETHQSSYGRGAGYDPRALHYWDRDDKAVPGFTQADLEDVLVTGSGPFYVDTTTVLSGTSQYWGYRIVDVEYDANGHLVLAKFGTAMDEATLEALAAEPHLFNPDFARFGLFSTPLVWDVDGPFSVFGELKTA